MLFRSFYPHYNRWKSELDIPGLGEIRYSFNPNNGMRYTVRDNDELIYVLITNGLCHKTRRVAPEWKGPEYTAVGWMYGAECKQDAWKYNQTTWYVPQVNLHAMNTLSIPVRETVNG